MGVFHSKKRIALRSLHSNPLGEICEIKEYNPKTGSLYALSHVMKSISDMGTPQHPWLPFSPISKLTANTSLPPISRISNTKKDDKLYIRSMVSLRCKIMVKAELEKLGIRFGIIELGSVELPVSVSRGILDELKKNLMISGLELLEDKKSILIEKIKNVIIYMVHHADELPILNYSEHISKELQYDYTYLANIFSEVTGNTIQQYIIKHKIERVKEFISYGELNMTAIADKLQYSSVAHLSNQFKKITGFSPSFYKLVMQSRKTNLENT